MDRILGLIISIIFIAMQMSGQEDLNLAKQYMQEQEYALALPIWEACAEDSTASKCIEQAGLAAYRLGFTSKAKQYFHRIEKDPTLFKSACINLAAIYDQQENIPRAIKYNSFLKDSFPDNPIYYRKIGSLLMKASLPKEAFASFGKALSLNPDDVTTIKAVSDIFVSNAQYREADSLLRHGLSIDSSNVGLSLLLARNFYKQRLYDSTVVVLDGLRGTIDFSNYFNKMYGYSLLQIDSVDQSIFYLQKSLVNEGDPEYAHYYLANAYEIKEDMEAAIYHLDEAIKTGTSAGLKSYHRNKARLLNKENKLRDAITAYEWAYRYDEDPLLLFYLGRACDAYYKDKNIAVRYYERYAKSKDDNTQYKEYAKDRARRLRENIHQSGSR